MDFFINAAQAQAAGGASAQGGIFNMLIFIPLFLAFYFLLIRPQNKRAKEQREMVAKLSAGDEVATTGGVLGKIVEVGDQYLTVEIAAGVNVKLQRFQVSQVLPKGTVKGA